MSGDVQALVKRCVVRYLNGDMTEFRRLIDLAMDLYELDRHLYVSIQERLEAKAGDTHGRLPLQSMRKAAV